MTLAADRFFDPDPAQKAIAMDLYYLIQNLPIVSPHGHVDPSLFSDPNRKFGNLVELFLRRRLILKRRCLFPFLDRIEWIN